MKTCILIPARKSPKNLRLLGGRHLIEYVIEAALFTGHSVILSTDDPLIRDMYGPGLSGIHWRAPEFSGDVPIYPVVKSFAQIYDEYEGIVLAQPTSPFFSVQDVLSVIQRLDDVGIKSVQTITPKQHNDLAANERAADGVWRYPKDRSGSNKQDKPEGYKFGNLLGIRRDALLADEWSPRDGLFLQPSATIQIPWYRAIDCDDNHGFELAEMYIRTRGRRNR